MLAGCDANSHNITWGSTNDNPRGNALLEFLVSKDLLLLNQGNEPTFVTGRRREVIDITLVTARSLDVIKGWHVSNEPSASDHRYIEFELQNFGKKAAPYRSPRDTEWASYRSQLQQGLTSVKTNLQDIVDIDLSADQLQDAIITAYEENCPLKTTKTKKEVPWWNRHLGNLRQETRKLFNKAKITGNWDGYARALTDYNKALRKAKRDSWRKFCGEVETTSQAARIHRILVKDTSNSVGTVMKPTGEYTTNGKETLQALLQVHFPGSKVTQLESNRQQLNLIHRAKRADWQTAVKTVSYERIKWAIGTFEPYKSPGPDGIYPALLQKGLDFLVSHLCRIYRACVAMGYVPEAWRTSNVVFIPKPGRVTYTEAKAYRPISLSSFLLKALEKLIDRHIREGALMEKPLHKHQHAYQPGKSCDTALHNLVARVETSLHHKEIALGAFIDIQGAFDNASCAAMITAAKRHGIDDTTCRWIHNMLKCRQVKTSLHGDSITAEVTQGCPQGGVLSPLLWNLVVDELLARLNVEGYYAQGYADDVVILIKGTYANITAELMQRALKIVQRWCEETNLKVNTAKTVILPFTKRKIAGNYNNLKIFGEQIKTVSEVKYLGLILDSKLNWKQQINKNLNKAKMCLMRCRSLFGKTWGLKPQMVLWLYVAVIRPIVTYGAVVWWTKTQQTTTATRLNSLQRLACLCISGAMKSTPTAALEIILGITPLDIHIKTEARCSASRMNANGEWKQHPGKIGHTKITDIINDELLEMQTDQMNAIYNFEKPFSIRCDSDLWTKGIPASLAEGLTWYTDGSKTADGAGAGIFGERPRVDITVALGKHATVYQAEIYAIQACVQKNLAKGYHNQTIHILSDSQAALKALNSYRFTSKITLECLNDLISLARKNKVELLWVPGHTGIIGNEKADELARAGAAQKLRGPEPALGISKQVTKTTTDRWAQQEHLSRWNSTPGQIHARATLGNPSKKLTAGMLLLTRSQIRQVTGLLTGHCHLRKHLHRIGIYNGSIECRLCGEEEETASHIIYSCEALNRRRNNIFGRIQYGDNLPHDKLGRKILDLIKGTNLF